MDDPRRTEMTVLLSKKKADIRGLARKALKDTAFLAELFKGIVARQETLRENSSKVLNLLSQEHPRALYPKWWGFFVELLDSENTYHKLSAVTILANLAKVDRKGEFEHIFHKYYGLLNDRSMITAAWVAGNSGKIARAKPHLQTKITNKLLSIDKTHHDPERRDLIKGSAILSLSEYFNEVEKKKRILDFVRKQLKGRSPRANKLAREFLERWDKSNPTIS